MKTVLTHKDGLALASTAMDRGAVAHPPTSIEWEACGDCLNRVWLSKESRPFRARGETGNPFWIDMWVPCRKCKNCLRRRAAHWRLRAQAEIMGSHRSWFGTLTLRPAEQFATLNEARVRSHRAGVVWETLSSEERFTRHHQVIGEELTRWLKRIRKESGAKLRYCLVVEAHKTGLPHYHLLIHEVTAVTVKHRTLSEQWKLGFSKFNLVTDKRAAGYVCKYLSKNAGARVRASSRYGNTGLDAIGEAIEAVKYPPLKSPREKRRIL